MHHLLKQPGLLIARLALIGLIAAIIVSCEKENESPGCQLTASATVGFVPMAVTFTGNASDADGKVVQYRFDVDGDGVFEMTADSGTFKFVYDVAGTFNPIMEVTDDKGATGSSKVTITVKPNKPAVIKDGYYFPTAGYAPLTVLFGGTAEDPDGTVVKYEWDFQGDGTFDFSSVSNGNTSFKYTTPGTYKATYRLTDSKGGPSIGSVTVTVKPVPTTYKYSGFDKMTLFKGAYWTYKNVAKVNNDSPTVYEMKSTLGDSVMIPVEGAGTIAVYKLITVFTPSTTYQYEPEYTHIGIKYGEIYQAKFAGGLWVSRLVFSAQQGTLMSAGFSGIFSGRYAKAFSVVPMPNLHSAKYSVSSVQIQENFNPGMCETILGELICSDESANYQFKEYYIPGIGYGGYSRVGTTVFYGSGGGTYNGNTQFFLIDTNVVK